MDNKQFDIEHIHKILDSIISLEDTMQEATYTKAISDVLHGIANETTADQFALVMEYIINHPINL